MNFSEAYNRENFVQFLQTRFLPDDYTVQAQQIVLTFTTNFAQSATYLGKCDSLDLAVFEVVHNSKKDARVGLAKDAFRLLAEQNRQRALVLFVPKDDKSRYRFSLIELKLELPDGQSRVQKTYSNPRRSSFVLGTGIGGYTPYKYLYEKGRVVDFEDLQKRFSVEVLTKEFYGELSDWYAWAIKLIRFPNNIKDDADDALYNHESAIRLITRLIFVWFLKQRHLVPDEFFDEQYLSEHLLKDFNPHMRIGLFNQNINTTVYYKAILQNLFFAMLNCPITSEGSDEVNVRRFRNGRSDYDINNVMRYENLFKNPQLFVQLANSTVPFLNGGLFDCLDDKQNEMYYDGFSDRKEVQKSLHVPDCLFFGDNNGETVDLSEWYGDKNKKRVSARGIIDILKRYNFTVEENTPFDKEVSLDPELLGKVFENLLAAYNPETQTTARKQTGSFYTPRDIVQYMVDESLVAYLKQKVGEDKETEYRKMLAFNDEELNLSNEDKQHIMQALYQCKILDPACGSGAFPIGVLQQMVHILTQIDPKNEMWRDLMRKQAIDETSEAYLNATDEERADMIKDIERSFNEQINRPDYARKLYLIENCIYGVDIQPIAIQISKLRFFISLVIDQVTNTNPADNFGIRPLPNLEAKFVAANSLIGLSNAWTLGDTPLVIEKKKQLKDANHRIFSAKTVKTKRKYKNRVRELRQELAQTLYDLGFISQSESNQLASWDMFNQNASSSFFEPDWMFGVKEGFDIVIGNPPYIDSEQMTANIPQERLLYKNLYETAKGNWDMFVIFIELGFKLTSNVGIYSFIVPNKLIAAKYTEAIRSKIQEGTIIELRDYGAVPEPVFVEAAVYPCTIVCHKQRLNAPSSFITMETIKQIRQQNMATRAMLASCEFLDVYFRDEDTLNLVTKIINYPQLKDLQNNKVFGAATVGEAYKVKEVMFDSDITSDALHIINTGTIDPYISLWGIEQMQYIKAKYLYPVILDEDVKAMNYTRYLQAKSPKIIVAGMSKRIEATYDNGDSLAGKSTTIILGEDLKYILGILNSKLSTYVIRIIYNSLQMAGGFINVGVRELENINIPKSDTEHKIKIESLVDQILSTKQANPAADITDLEHQIDELVYKLYDLTDEEIQIIESSTN